MATSPLLDPGDRPPAVAPVTGRLSRVPEIGELVGSKYKVESVIGRGGMGVVLGARHVTLRERVAIKVLLFDPTSRGAFTSRFLQEAQVTAQLRNEHIARVIDIGTLGDSTPYMVMEYVEGHDLREVLQQGGKLPIPVAIEYIVQACEGLAEAHAAGVVHRDLKPPNLFLTTRSDGSDLVKILDFGISKLLSAEKPVSDLTETGVVMGSPKYMSPEQFGTSTEVDTRADIWALGTILYELVTGVPAFDEPTLATVCSRVISGVPPRSMRKKCPEASEALENAVLHCLALEQDDRPADVAELASELLAAAGAPDATARTAKIRATLGRPAPEKRIRAARASVPETPLGVRAPVVATPEPRSRRGLVTTLVIIALSGILIGRELLAPRASTSVSTEPARVAAPMVATPPPSALAPSPSSVQQLPPSLAAPDPSGLATVAGAPSAPPSSERPTPASPPSARRRPTPPAVAPAAPSHTASEVTSAAPVRPAPDPFEGRL